MSSTCPKIYVINRYGKQELINEDKITKRIKKLCNMDPILENVDVKAVIDHVVNRVHSGVSTRELDAEASRYCATN